MEIMELKSTITDIKKIHWGSRTDMKWQKKELTNLKMG